MHLIILARFTQSLELRIAENGKTHNGLVKCIDKNFEILKRRFGKRRVWFEVYRDSWINWINFLCQTIRVAKWHDYWWELKCLSKIRKDQMIRFERKMRWSKSLLWSINSMKYMWMSLRIRKIHYNCRNQRILLRQLILYNLNQSKSSIPNLFIKHQFNHSQSI